MDAPFEKVCGDAGFGIHYFKEAESTNDLAQKPSYKHKDIIIADIQTRGRGQRGSNWESEPGKNLTFSLIIDHHDFQAAKQFLLSKVASLALTDMLESYRIKAAIKWPNDIYIGDKKVAGILIENNILGTMLSRSVIGIGLNINQKEFGSDLPNPVSMSMAANREFKRDEVLTRFCNYFALRCEQLYDSKSACIDESYFARLYLANTPHKFKLPEGNEFEGTIRNVAESGELTVETGEGNYRTFLFKEIIF